MQLTVSELIKKLQKIEAQSGGDRLVSALEKEGTAGVLTGIVIVETVTVDEEDGEVVLGEAS